MQRSDSNAKDYQALLSKIVSILLHKGLKSATMDSVAAELGMSKRTLYEIFESKSQMIMEALGELERNSEEHFLNIFKQSANVMEALIQVFQYNRDLMGSVNVDFYRDMDRLYKDKREHYEHTRLRRHERMLGMFELGVEQGMFRKDVDYRIQSRMMALQMEGLKRIEELFPQDITLQRVFDSIIVSFLRSIATPEGMKILDKWTNKNQTNYKINENFN